MLSPANQKKERSGRSIHPVVLRLLHYPIPEEIRSFVWSALLDVRHSHMPGNYYALAARINVSIPEHSLYTMKADLNRYIPSVDELYLKKLYDKEKADKEKSDKEKSDKEKADDHELLKEQYNKAFRVLV